MIKRWLLRTLTTGIATAVATVFFLWLVMLSPFLYHPPGGPMPVDDNIEHRVFAYGTLTSSTVRWLVAGHRGDEEAAVLPQYRREQLNIVPDPDTQTEGVVFTVTGEQLRRLDRYERVGIRYERVMMTLDDGRRAWVYRRL